MKGFKSKQTKKLFWWLFFKNIWVSLSLQKISLCYVIYWENYFSTWVMYWYIKAIWYFNKKYFERHVNSQDSKSEFCLSTFSFWTIQITYGPFLYGYLN